MKFLTMGYNIYNTCALCHTINKRFVRVCIQDHLQILKKRMKEFVKFNPYSFLLMCENCVMKLRIFTKCDSNIYSLYSYRNMQETSETKEDITKSFEDTSCQCNHCKAKYGNLPLLAEVIEKIENKSNEKINENSIKSDEEKNINICDSDRIVKKSIVIEDNNSQPSTSKESVGRKIFNCEHCDKTFTHKGDFNKHLRKHTGEQPFQCPVCSRKFAHTSNLARHLRVHSGDKPFQCERCNKSFSRKDKLLMHQKTKLCLNSSFHS